MLQKYFFEKNMSKYLYALLTLYCIWRLTSFFDANQSKTWLPEYWTSPTNKCRKYDLTKYAVVGVAKVKDWKIFAPEKFHLFTLLPRRKLITASPPWLVCTKRVVRYQQLTPQHGLKNECQSSRAIDYPEPPSNRNKPKPIRLRSRKPVWIDDPGPTNDSDSSWWNCEHAQQSMDRFISDCSLGSFEEDWGPYTRWHRRCSFWLEWMWTCDALMFFCVNTLFFLSHTNNNNNNNNNTTFKYIATRVLYCANQTL
jgi:hypothetical protein